MPSIVPSIASANPFKLNEELTRLGQVERLHVDIEDGNFVPNITFGLGVLSELAANSSALLDVHLLVTNPGPYIKACASSRVGDVAVHYEAVAYPLEAMNTIRDAGMRCGLALNFKTPADALLPFADAMDYVLVMTAEPDGRNQQFAPATLEKIRRARNILPPQAAIWVDGAIDAETMPRVFAAGADVAVVGRAIWQAPDPAEAYAGLSRAAETFAKKEA